MPAFSDMRRLYRRLSVSGNYRLARLGGGRWAGYCQPAEILILMTNLCNARCVHCDIWKNKGREDTPTVDEYKSLLSQLRQWLGPAAVTFTGGEALLRPYTVELVAHASGIGLAAEVLTHGYWDDQSRMEALARANPARVTVSLDGIGDAHTAIRGREKFFEKTSRSLATLQRLRAQEGLDFTIRLKTVIMRQNLCEVDRVARYAAENGCEVFYQPVEQNYNTPDDARWFEHSDNWPRDARQATAAVRRLMELKRQGLPIRNTYEQLEVMIPYFETPDALRVSVQQHSAHSSVPLCSAITNMQVMPNGDVLTCYGMPPAGNIRQAPIRSIWANRQHWWQGGCCHETRFSDAEKETRGLVALK